MAKRRGKGVKRINAGQKKGRRSSSRKGGKQSAS
jgi:hypothetical protein